MKITIHTTKATINIISTDNRFLGDLQRNITAAAQRKSLVQIFDENKNEWLVNPDAIDSICIESAETEAFWKDKAEKAKEAKFDASKAPLTEEEIRAAQLKLQPDMIKFEEANKRQEELNKAATTQLNKRSPGRPIKETV
jgi:hypothetical protein